MAFKTENIGWGISFQMVLNNYYKSAKSIEYVSPKPKRIKRKQPKNLGFYDNPVKMEMDIDEHQRYLQSQTLEQFRIAKKQGWRVAKLLTEPQINFHYE